MDEIHVLPDSHEELEILVNSKIFYVPNMIGEIEKYYNNGKFENIELILFNVTWDGFNNIFTAMFCNEWIDLIEYFYVRIEFGDFYFVEKSLNIAFKLGKLKTAQYIINLINLGKIIISQYNIEKLFKSALLSDSIDIVLLLFYYINPNCILDKFGNTPLMLAIKYTSHKCANFLIDYSDLTLVNKNGRTPLMLISSNDNNLIDKIFLKILNKSRNYIETEDNFGYTAKLLCNSNYLEYFT